MPSTILSDNGVTSGTAGIKTTGSNDGQLALQTTTAGGAATTALEINTSQQVSFTAGTAAAPAITPTGDTNTGIFFPAADTIAFAEGGAEAMRIDSSGNVGVGTSSPGAQLEVSRSSTSGYSTMRLSNTGASGRTYEIGLGGNTAAAGYANNLYFYDSTAAAIRMVLDSSGNVGIGTSSPANRLHVVDSGGANGTIKLGGSEADLGLVISYDQASSTTTTITSNPAYTNTLAAMILRVDGDASATANQLYLKGDGNVGIGTSSPSARLTIPAPLFSSSTTSGMIRFQNSNVAADSCIQSYYVTNEGSDVLICANSYINTSGSFARFSGSYAASAIAIRRDGDIYFATNTSSGNPIERARITSDGNLLVGKTVTASATVGVRLDGSIGFGGFTRADGAALAINRQSNDGDLVLFLQADTQEGSISVSGNTVSYNSFAGAHWSQLQQGRGYNPETPRGTVMSSIGEMAEWKSVIWDEVIEHPAIPAVEAVEGKEAVLDEEGNVIEPAVEAVAAVEGKDAWTETINKREAYLGDLAVGATFTEDGVTKTVVDDGNERLPKVKISDVVGDKAVYGVFQTYDEVQDMLVTALGAFVVRIAANDTVQIGDLLESNGDGCAKVQDDDVIRSKTIGKVTSTVKTATYADGSYTVPCVLYCG